ncbi:hypothetical protein IFR04_005801 [Cadophora malorum]|uniref:Uncharacterized protein n=1 Tax=Cadophora malorum TaxID=108018 RepID=A0A8H7TLG1_9HELO|nr:hypothetical protein IFR04_005801 [Cadophora malorum]
MVPKRASELRDKIILSYSRITITLLAFYIFSSVNLALISHTSETERPRTPTRPIPRRPARVFRNSDGQPSSPIGTTYSPGGTAQNPTAITVPDVAAPDRPQTPETPDGTGELRRALREGSAGTDFRGWTRSSLFDSEDPLLGLFARVQRISHILQASVTFVAGPPAKLHLRYLFRNPPTNKAYLKKLGAYLESEIFVLDALRQGIHPEVIWSTIEEFAEKPSKGYRGNYGTQFFESARRMLNRLDVIEFYSDLVSGLATPEDYENMDAWTLSYQTLSRSQDPVFKSSTS